MSSIKLSPNASGTGIFTIAAPNSNNDRTLNLPDQSGTIISTDSSGAVILPRVDSSNEGGQINFNRASDNTAVWSIDSFGSTSTPTLRFINGATVAAAIDGSNNVGIGTSSPTDTNGFGRVLDVQSPTGAALFVRDSDSPTTLHAYFGFLGSNSTTYVWNKANGPMLFAANDAERARINSDGDFLVGTTLVGNSGSNCRMQIAYPGGSTKFGLGFRPAADNTSPIQFGNASGVTVGTISTSSTATAYNTSSDYRLKHDIAPMTGALAKVAALKPVTYKWNADGSDGEGFIAHELAEVCPQAVTGEKDAVETYADEEGNEQTRPVYQGIDTSFLVATLTAAIKEQQAIIESLTTRIAALEAL